MDPITLLGMIGSLSSIVSLTLGLIKTDRFTKDALPKILEESDAAANILSKSQAAISAVAKISREILDVIERRISKRRKEIIEDLDDDTLTPRQQRSQIEAAKADICRMLEYVKDFNQGVLPDDLEQVWVEMNCS